MKYFKKSLLFCLPGAILFSGMLLVSCRKKQPDYESANPPCVKVDGYRELPDTAHKWMDSLLIYKLVNKNILLTSSNGLSETISIEVDSSDDPVAIVDCNDYDLEQHLFSYTSSLFAHNFELNKQFGSHSLMDGKFEAYGAGMYLVCEDKRYPYYFTGSNYNWRRIGYMKVGGKKYFEVYIVQDMLDSWRYANALIDMHYGLIQFTTVDNTDWTLHYE